MVIDCHTHLLTENSIKEYLKKYGKKVDYMISIRILDSIFGNGEDYFDIFNNNKIFGLDYIDIEKDIEEQLVNIENRLKKYKLIGIKIYLGYQSIFANDEKLFKVYAFAQKHRLTIVFHCGLVEKTKSSDAFLKYSSCEPIDEVCVKFPKVNFIISHLDFPNISKCIGIVDKNPNCYTDISGILENADKKKVKEMKTQLAKDLTTQKNYYINLEEKIMFGSDYYCEESSLNILNEYLWVLKKVFGKRNKKKYAMTNCLKAYPLLVENLKK